MRARIGRVRIGRVRAETCGLVGEVETLKKKFKTDMVGWAGHVVLLAMFLRFAQFPRLLRFRKAHRGMALVAGEIENWKKMNICQFEKIG